VRAKGYRNKKKNAGEKKGVRLLLFSRIPTEAGKYTWVKRETTERGSETGRMGKKKKKS